MSRNDERILSLLGLANRARMLVTGETVINDLKKGLVKCVIVASDASENTKKRMMNKCAYYNVPVFVYGSSDELSRAIGKRNRMSVGILDEGFADKIKSMIGG